MKLTRTRVLVAAIVILLLGAYALFGFFGAPRLLRSQTTDFISAKYHRKADLGAIEFNPFTLVLRVHGFSFPDADGQPLLGFRDLMVNLSAASLWHLAPDFQAIELEQPFTRVVIRKDGSLNLADLARPFDAGTTTSEPESPLRLAIDRFRVGAGQIDFEDQSRASVFHTRLSPIGFELRDFATTGQAGNFYSLRASSAAQERFAWDGRFALTPFGSSGHFEVAALHATTLWSYLRDTLAFEITSGTIDLAGDYQFSARDSNLQLNVKNVTVADLALHGAGAPEDDVKLDKLAVTNAKIDLNRRRVDVEKTALSGLALHARRDAQGHVNLLELGGSSPTPAVEGAAPVVAVTQVESAGKPAVAPWVVSAPDISLEGAIDIDDALVKPAARFALSPVAIRLGGYSNAPGTTVALEANLAIDGAGKLAIKGDLVPDTATLAVHVDLNDFKLASLQPYLGTYTQMTLSEGSLTTGLDVKRDAQGALTLVGDIDVAKLHTVDNALKQDFIKWDRLKLAGFEYGTDPARLRIATVTATAPYARVIIAPDQTINVSKVLSAPSGSMPAPVQTVKTPAGTHAAAPPSMRVSIGTVRVVNGAANFADFWIQPNYAVNLQGMNGSVLGLSSDPKSRAKVSIEGKVDRYAPAKIEGDINLLSAALYTDLKVSFKGVEMTSVTPYSGHFAGYKIEKGKLSIDVAYLVENRKLQARQHFVIDQLELGERVESPDAVKLPLRLAVALLKDSNGVIDIDLPMTGSLDDPQFRMGPLIWKAFVGLIGKAATAPFKLLGSLFGGGEEMNLIEFDAGDAALDDAAKQKIASITKALNARPALQLDIPTSYSLELDRTVLESRAIDTALHALPKADDAALADPVARFDLLVTQYQADYGAKTALPAMALALQAKRKSARDPAEFPAANRELEQALAMKHPVSERDLEQLGQSRAHAVQDALLGVGTIDAGRIFILGANATAPTDKQKVRLELSLK